jgi:hypothetical protein
MISPRRREGTKDLVGCPRRIDTRQLSDGAQRLPIRADWGDGPLAGALVVPLMVSNR